MKAHAFAALLGIAVASASASAQRTDSASARTGTGDERLACAASGLRARAWSGDAKTPSAQRPVSAAPSRRAGTLDTTIVLSIVNRTWQRDDASAGVALGGGAVSSRGPWSACAGASVHLSRVTAQLRNVAGNVHFRADMSALDSIGRTRNSTPPAGPPRR